MAKVHIFDAEKPNETEEIIEPATEQYEVLVSFTDATDGAVYWAGKDLYPRDGAVLGKDRIASLLGAGNAFGRPVIKAQK